jgi:iron(III) transport system ATP-binding protein
MNVHQNVAYPLVRRRAASAEIDRKVKSYLGLVNCLDFAERFPHQLSGGQQQRIALARALVAEPNLVLFDEPLSSLDAYLREELRFQIREIKRRVAFTGLYVTHDHSEALFIADRIAIIGDGKVLQVGASAELYDAPSSAEVADFLGFTNTLVGSVESAGSALQFRSEIGPITLPTDVPAGTTPPTGRATLKCHPSRVEFQRDPASVGVLPGKIIDLVRAAPDTLQYVVELAPGIVWQCWGSTSHSFKIGDRVHLRPSPDHLHLFEE